MLVKVESVDVTAATHLVFDEVQRALQDVGRASIALIASKFLWEVTEFILMIAAKQCILIALGEINSLLCTQKACVFLGPEFFDGALYLLRTGNPSWQYLAIAHTVYLFLLRRPCAAPAMLWAALHILARKFNPLSETPASFIMTRTSASGSSALAVALIAISPCIIVHFAVVPRLAFRLNQWFAGLVQRGFNQEENLWVE